MRFSIRTIWLALGLLMPAAAVFGADGESQSLFTTDVAVDTLWVLVAGFLVFFMNLGFGCVEAGFCRAKNAVNILGKNFVVFGIASLAFFVVGWSLMFGNGSGFAGWAGFFLNGADNSPATGDAYQGAYEAISWTGIPLTTKFFFQLVFAATAATIVSGCVAERIHYRAFIIFATLLVAVAYPITGHWIWGGGWLASKGMWDFAGSTVVHSVGGWAGLAGIIVLGPRIGKYRKEGKVHPIPGHSMGLVFIGGLVLWLGWFGFNPGSVMAISGENALAVSHVAITTNLAGSAGLISATLMSWGLLGKPDFGMTVNGLLAGLVAITAPCAWVTPIGAIVIGAVGGIIVVVSVLFFDKLKIDDPVGALSVHLANGIWGTLAIGLFANPTALGYAPGEGGPLAGLFVGGGATQLGYQFLGVIAVGGFTLAFAFVLWALIKVTLDLRVSPTVEVEGLDRHEMGGEAYPLEPAIDVGRLLVESHLGRHAASLMAAHDMPEIRSAKMPPPAERYAVRVEGIPVDVFMRKWSDWCGMEKTPPPNSFREIYPYLTTVSNSVFRFRGGDRQQVASYLGELAKSVAPEATVKLEDAN
jgi:Amt family ammonium transporter